MSGLQLFILRLARAGVLASVFVALVILFAKHFWISDLLANLRVQVIAAMTIALAMTMLARRKHLVFVTLGCLALQLVPFARSYRSIESHKDDRRSFTVMTLNVLTSNQNTDAIVDAILASDAGLVALLEVSEWHCDQIIPELDPEYPYRHLELDRQGNFGLALFSREPFDDIRVFQATPNIDSIEVTWNGIQVIATHPLPPMGANHFQMRNRHLQEVASRVSQISARMPKVPVVVMGDFNLTPWSPWMRKFETASKLSRVASGIGLRPTWYARPNRFLSGLVLDHVLVSDHLNCTDYNVGGDIGSDHRGVIVRLQRSDD